MFMGWPSDYGCTEFNQPSATMGLPIAALSRLVDRNRLGRVPGGAAWRVPVTALLLLAVVPVLLTAAVATVPVLLSAGLLLGVRRVWQWQAQRRRAALDDRAR